MRAPRRALLGLCSVLALAACDGPAPDPLRSPDAPEDGAGGAAAGSDRSPAGEDAELLRAAEQVLAFLDGSSPLDPALVADMLTLHVAPEGGGERATLTGAARTLRSAWSAGGHSFLPPPGATNTSMRIGGHFRCVESSLAAHHPELAPFPHVGIKREPEDAESCLQSWNLTLLFAPGRSPPLLRGAFYDQWEW